MAFRFTAKTTVRTSVRRIVREQIDRALAELRNDDLSRDKRIHQARKRFKRIRAVLRLVRDELGSTFATENTWYREAGRHFSHLRDAQAMVEVCEKLLGLHHESDHLRSLTELRESLAERRAEIGARAEEDGNGVAVLISNLVQARDRVRTWNIQNDSFAALAPGLSRAYRQARNSFRTAYEDPRPENFHEWRKRVKDSWHHAELFQNIWPEVMKGLAGSLHGLSDVLGENQDLNVLRLSVCREPDRFAGVHRLGDLSQLIGERQAQLRRSAETVGRRVYAEKRGEHTERIGAYWDAWLDERRHT
jgi:CHAD domain-containing protein